MGNTNALKHIFEKIDKDGNGKINLSELYMSTDEDATEVVSVCSLPTLYHFDLNKEGFLNFKEFVEMENFVQKIEKQVTKSQKLKHMEEPTVYKIRDDSSSVDSMSVPSSPNAENGGYLSNGNASSASSPQLTRSISVSSLSDNTGVPRFDSKKEGMKRNASDDELYVQHEVKKQISIALLPSLHKEMYGRQGRERFLEWLFKLCDISKTGYISKDELQIFIAAVEHDDIDVESLVFSDDDDKKKLNIVQRIMKEYDTANLGVLSKDEFLKLADVVMNKYEAKHTLLESMDDYIVGDWRFGSTLGEGGYGIVKFASHIETGAKRAVKRIKRGNVSDMSKLDVEIEAMKILEHPNVVRLYEVIEDQQFIYLVMELCGGGSLYEYLKEKPFEEDLARYYFTTLIDGLMYCHEKGVCHRDLRLENLLLDNFGNLKITDFGQAGIFKKGWDLFSTQLVGSLYHLSPEQINGKVYSGEKIDMWSAGIILYCFLTARLPFCSSAVVEMLDDIKNARYTYPEDAVVSDAAKDLISRLLRSNPEERLTPDIIKLHPWMQGERKKPQLALHQLKINVKASPESREIIRTKIEEILVNESISVINCYDLETDAKNCIFAKALILNPQQITYAFKCINAHNIASMKFLLFIGFTNDNTVCIETQLKDGEVKEFNDISNMLNKKIQKELKQLIERCSTPQAQ